MNNKEIILEWFKNKYHNLYEEMNKITHDHSNGNKNPYHMEGTILRHTEMVLEWLDSNDENLILAALLHDLGKLYTRDEAKDKVHFTKHENVSTYKCIDILKNAKKDFQNINIIKIIKLIAWHGTLWVRKDFNEEEFVRNLDYRYGHDIEFYNDLVKFVEADAFGRIYSDKEQESFILNQFSFLYNYTPYDKMKYRNNNQNSEVLFLIGLSGSGKTTYLDKNKEIYKNYKILSVDNILTKGKLNYNSIDYKKNVKKAYNEVILNMLESIKLEKNVIIDMTNLDKENRRRKLSKFPSTKYIKKAIVFLNGEQTIYNNLNKRENKTISKDIIEQQIFNFELPNYDEFDIIEYIL